MSDSVSATINHRRQETSLRVERLRARLFELRTAELLGESACIYATGSVGRLEASTHSDLDVFIVSATTTSSSFGRLESIQVFSRLVDAAAELQFPPFSNDGEYLKIHALPDLIDHLGTREDDHTNVFTARMLLLLESRAVLGEAVYDRAIRTVVATYWRDYEGNEGRFLPAFLANDIVRYWKVLCLGYEAHGDASVAERRVLNYKLKHSRLLTCYSALLYFAWVLRARATVTPDDAVSMARLTPTQRLEFIARDSVYAAQVRRLLEMYAIFLSATDAKKQVLVERFGEHGYHEARRSEARSFGDAVFRLLFQLADQSDLLRYLVV